MNQNVSIWRRARARADRRPVRPGSLSPAG